MPKISRSAHRFLTLEQLKNLPKPHWIYTLVDPRDGSVRYVGYSSNVKQRYQYHCGMCDRTSNTYEWVDELKKRGIKPLLFIVEEVDTWRKAQEREAYWMRFYFAEGEPLVNRIDNLKRQQEAEEKHSCQNY